MKHIRRYKDSMIVTSVTIILIAVISITSSDRGNMSRTESMLGKAVTPIQKTTTSLGKSVVDKSRDKESLREENEQLKKELVELRDIVRKQDSVIKRKDFLEREYKLLKESEFNLTKAEVIGKDPGNWVEKFVIDKGKRDGIVAGDIVVQGTKLKDNTIVEGLVGRVVSVGDSWSRVVSIIDNTSSVSFIDSRTQDGGIARGSLEGKVIGELFDMNSVVTKGDKVFSSGLGGVFPKNLYIGEIENIVNREDNLLLNVEIRPSVNFSKLKDVFVLKKD